MSSLVWHIFCINEIIAKSPKIFFGFATRFAFLTKKSVAFLENLGHNRFGVGEKGRLPSST